jgi:hypothetical protein
MEVFVVVTGAVFVWLRLPGTRKIKLAATCNKKYHQQNIKNSDEL